MASCHNCEKRAMFAVGDKRGTIPLCLNCYIALQSVLMRQNEMLERQINYLTDEIESVAGFSSVLPRFPEQRHLVVSGNNPSNIINVSNSQIGVLNTGAVQTIESSLTVLRAQAKPDLVAAVKALTEGVIDCDNLSASQKEEVLEILGMLSQEAVVPSSERRVAVAKTLMMRLHDILQGITGLLGLWSKTEEAFRTVFG